MQILPLPPNETDRLEALYSYSNIDTLPELAFDELTRLAAYVCNTPIALVSLIDNHRQRCKSRFGIAATETGWEWTFCAHAILQPEQPLIVPDTLKDERFANKPLVISEPNIRFYAGVPIVTTKGDALGTLCVIDCVPRQLQPQQLEALQALGRQVSRQLESRLNLCRLMHTNQLLRRSEERFRLLVEGVNDYAIFLLAPDGRVVSWNTGAEQIKGYQTQQILGQHFSCFYTIADIKQGKPELGLKVAVAKGRFEDEGWRVRQDGSQFWAHVAIAALHDQSGKLYGFATVTRDLTEQKQAEAALLRAAVAEATNQKLEAESLRQRIEAQLIHHAFYDTLTGLPNRALLLERLKRALVETRQRKDYLFAVLFLDLDRFKLVNDSLGHQFGDELLIGIARRLSACLSTGDTLARIGGDEFVLLLEEIQTPRGAIQTAERLQAQLSLPFNLGGQQVFATVSIGIALNAGVTNPRSYERPEDILRDADTAMNQAKALGRARYEVFDIAMHAQVLERLQLETDLRHALARQEFLLHYQPITWLKTGRISGFEALIRWQHPERGTIFPDKFIAIAEETGLIVPIGQWVLLEACKQLRAWQVQFPANPPLTMSVNLSVKQFAQPGLVQQITQVLQQTNLEAEYLKLEITESVLMENTEAIAPVLSQLKALGVTLCLDDFGTGYSSLNYLHRFSLDVLKIDRSFVQNVGLDSRNSQIVQAIIKLAEALGIEAIAEGIETVEQQVQLSRLYCRFGQGHLFSQPLDSDTVGKLLAQQLTQTDDTPVAALSPCLHERKSTNPATIPRGYLPRLSG